MPNFNLTYQKDGENEQLYYKDAHNNDLYIRSCEDFAPAIIQEKSGNPIAITDGADCPIRKLKVIFEPIQDGSGDPSPDNVRPFIKRESVTVERTGKNLPPQSVIIPLGQTVYGGTLDVVGGVLTVRWATVDLGALNWSRTASYQKPVFYAGLENKKYPSQLLCSIFKFTGNFSGVQSFLNASGNSTIGACIVNRQIYVREDSCDSVSAFVDFIRNRHVAYELATPQTIPLDPATLSTLKGENTFSTDGTSIELEYVVDTKTYIDNLINSGKKTVVKPNDEIKIIDENKGVE